ncbi:Protein kinase domain-containing protein [Cladophialophora immunda]|nr:Protein kinase domain-containing protein [Cladophialophora immunda]
MRLNPVADDSVADPKEKEIVERVKARRPGNQLLDLDRALLIAPQMADGWNSFLGSVRSDTKNSLPTSIRQVAIARTVALNRGWYAWTAHHDLLLAATDTKISTPAIDYLLSAEPKSAHATPPSGSGFTEKHMAVIAYVDYMTKDLMVPDAVFERLRQQGFSDREIVEITLCSWLLRKDVLVNNQTSTPVFEHESDVPRQSVLSDANFSSPLVFRNNRNINSHTQAFQGGAVGMQHPDPQGLRGPSRECHCPSPIFSTKHLGEGTSGVARKLSDTASGQIVVVKTHGLRHEDESEEAYLAFIQNEYRTASSLWHPNIVETYDIYQDEHEAWHQVMEPLAVRLDRLLEVTENASWDIIDSIFSHIVQGIAHMHSLEIAHMDIKVENIGISAAGAVKIFDFGSAHPILGAGGVPNLAQGIHGTLPYLAPEILKNTPYSPAAADVWALAILYIRISTGQFPWEKARLWDTSFRMFCRDDAEFKPTSGLRSIGDLPDLPIDSKSMRGPANILSHLVEAYESTDKRDVDYQWLRGDTRLTIVGGSDTTAATLTFLFHYLAKDPVQVEKLSSELGPLLKGGPRLDPKDVSKAQHLNGVIQEALRLHPAIPSGFPRVTPLEGITINDFFIPGGTTVVIPPYAMQHDDANYVFAEEFIPERWYSKPELIKNPEAFLTWNIGMNGCIGRALAIMEMRDLITYFIHAFESVKFAPGEDGRALMEETRDHFTVGVQPLRLIFEEKARGLANGEIGTEPASH